MYLESYYSAWDTAVLEVQYDCVHILPADYKIETYLTHLKIYSLVPTNSSEYPWVEFLCMVVCHDFDNLVIFHFYYFYIDMIIYLESVFSDHF